MPDSFHCVPRSNGGERGNHFIGWVSLSLVTQVICMIAGRYGGNDLMMAIGQSG